MIKHQFKNSRGNYNYNAYTYFGVNWKAHFHSNFELIYVIDGKIYLTVNGDTNTVSSGEYALVLSNQIHAILPDGFAQYWIAVFSEQYVPHFAKEMSGFEGETSVFSCDADTDAFIKSKLIFSESSALMIKKACFYAVCDCYSKQTVLKKRVSGKRELICEMLDYIAAHYTERLTLATVGAHFGYEPHYLSRMLNEKYQISFSALVNEHRVNHAARLIENGELTMAEVAMQSGFSSIRNFNHAFKSVTGRTPTEYVRAQSNQ
ncbi:MAG: AraC family transcriptional regulator [Ruminococcaceae bacterium]|nr:AraC family transcriptional regulator [Oscillospiraceae bacterium]